MNTNFPKNRIDQRSTDAVLLLPALRIAAVCATALLLMAGTTRIGDTVSYYAETETSTNNRFVAASVYITTSAIPENIGLRVASVAGSLLAFEVVIESESTLPTEYTVRAEMAPDANIGCGDISVRADIADYIYVGLLKDLDTPATSTVGLWEFELTLPGAEALPYDALCSGDIVFEAKVADALPGAENAYTALKRYPFELRQVPTPATEPKIEESEEQNMQNSILGGDETLEANDDMPMPDTADEGEVGETPGLPNDVPDDIQGDAPGMSSDAPVSESTPPDPTSVSDDRPV